jgi:iron complex outermembrane receptor protein
MQKRYTFAHPIESTVKKIYLFAFSGFALGSLNARAQSNADVARTDTIKELTVRGYLSERPMLTTPASVGVITPSQLQLQAPATLVPAMNTVPGVRMEERSPGSYRLSVRGSLLRSPFGVRDVKIYYDEIPLTDAGGNSYLNALDFNAIQGVEILKGPDGSLFGANSGGVVLLSPVNRNATENFVKAGVNFGSYGLFQQNFSTQQTKGRNQFNLSQAYQNYGGYREHSSMRRFFVQAADKIGYGRNNSIKILGFYSELGYQTPGGLTAAELAVNPRAARPNAITQNIRVNSKMLLGGAVNEVHITNNLRNVLSVYGSYVDFSNPFVTNWEQRYEGTYGMRSYFELTGNRKPNFDWKANVGLEWQLTNSDINNYDNNKDVRGNAQALDKVNTDQHFFFARYEATFFGKLHAEAAASLNFYSYKFKNLFPANQTDYTKRTFDQQFMPRIALSYSITNDFVWRASVSKGYSTPTTAEIRPSDNLVNTALQPQQGWNYESGFRFRTKDESLLIDASIYYYHLNNAIVRLNKPGETNTFFNAGETKQLGFEAYATWWIIKQKDYDFIRGLQLNLSYTRSRFKFGNYSTNAGNFSDNYLTGVPQHVLVSSAQIKFPAALYLFVQHNRTSYIPLNDANTVFSAPYDLVQARVGWQYKLSQKARLELFAGADNILNKAYGLGNDINPAAPNRYFNPSPPRNYYGGMNVIF